MGIRVQYQPLLSGDLITVLIIQGRIDASTALTLKTDLKGIPIQGDIVLNLEAVPFLDSMGVTFLVSLHKFCKERRFQFVLSGIQEQPFRLLQLCSLDSIFMLSSSLPKALNYISQNRDQSSQG
jgi:anti-anti-sigma factor